MKTPKREITPAHWQYEVLTSDYRFKVINCGRRAGKSFLASLAMLKVATDKNNQIVWYVAPTYRQAKAIMWQMLKELVPEQIIVRLNETDLIIELKNGSTIFLKGADNPDSLRGVRIDFCIFDEVAFIKDWTLVWKVIRPTLIDTQADVWFISTPNGFNHFYDMSLETKPGWHYYHFTTYDNPYIESSEIEQMKLEMDEDSFAQEIMGEFKRMVGLVYKEFDRDTHMVEVPPLNTGDFTFTRSLDFGYAHKSALIYFAIRYDGSEIYAYDGLYKSNLVPQDIASVMRIKDAGRQMTNPVADSAQPSWIEEIKREGIALEAVVKAPDSVKSGIPIVAGLLRIRKDTGKPTLMFSKELDWIAREFESYQWLESQQGQFMKDVPLKRDDDAMDAIRYFALSYAGPVHIDTSWIKAKYSKESNDSW